ncbi:glycoside hydrolase family 19 protein [Sulfurimonas sp.]|uniref:glycoside hydrolase family 19 protein n=1 Tax=Sulfurimonas sp. TaxID=2022749 RepID=UPI003D14F7E8
MNTKKMIQRLFPKTKNIDEIVEILHRYTQFGTNTNQRMAHFLAQVREEVGSEFKPVSENLNYSEEAALKLFKSMTPELAEKYARDEDTPVADQVAIANIAYANRIGNGDMDTDKDGTLDEDDDGWKYRGAGVLQITGKHNYEEVQKRIKKYAPETTINILENDIHTLEGAILAGLGFWIWKDLYRYADAGISHKDIDNITRSINRYTHSYKERKQHFDKIKDLV